MRTEDTNTFWCKIFISGPLTEIEKICRRECSTGLCVTVQPTKFIYTGGEEVGAEIGLINYPKYPDTKDNIFIRAELLAKTLLLETFQHSVLIMTPSLTRWITTREGESCEK